jgi:Zn-finger nucleic acid-binding protein
VLCPACQAQMSSAQTYGATVQVCSGCAACWTTRSGMQAVVESIERRFTAATLAALRAECLERRRAVLSAPAPSSASYRKCPECGVQMHRKAFAPFSGIVADVCAAHGFLLGTGRLEAIRDYVGRGGEVLALEASNQELADHLTDLKRKVNDLEQAEGRTGGSVDIFFAW